MSLYIKIFISLDFTILINLATCLTNNSALIECHIDAGRREDAINVAQVAATFTKTHIPESFKDVFELQVITLCITKLFK